jgi:hypothetical protein
MVRWRLTRRQCRNGEINEFTFDTDHSIVRNEYSSLYAIIYKANLIIDQVAPETQEMKRCIAEARFFRAWSHFELVTLWGTAPVVDHLLSPASTDPQTAAPRLYGQPSRPTSRQPSTPMLSHRD